MEGKRVYPRLTGGIEQIEDEKLYIMSSFADVKNNKGIGITPQILKARQEKRLPFIQENTSIVVCGYDVKRILNDHTDTLDLTYQTKLFEIYFKDYSREALIDVIEEFNYVNLSNTAILTKFQKRNEELYRNLEIAKRQKEDALRQKEDLVRDFEEGISVMNRDQVGDYMDNYLSKLHAKINNLAIVIEKEARREVQEYQPEIKRHVIIEYNEEKIYLQILGHRLKISINDEIEGEINLLPIGMEPGTLIVPQKENIITTEQIAKALSDLLFKGGK